MMGTVGAGANVLVGRESTLAEIRAAQAGDARVVTLVGLGGIGKTRLANAIADAADPVIHADATSARTRAELCAVVARAADVRADDSPDDSLERRVGETIARRGTLLVVIDNFEQLAPDAAELVERWTRAAPHASFLVTSRRPLEIAGERVVAIEPLSLPSDAAALFYARGAGRVHAPSAGDRALVDDIVRCLEGIPLAIELAAARLDVLPLAAIASRLEERFALLKNPLARTERHGTMFQSLEWSWDLLEPWQRTALARLSLFEGPFRIEDAEAVVGEDALDAVHALARHSLARADQAGVVSLLDTVRAYAATKLAEHDEARRKHTKLFVERGLAAIAEIDARGAAPDLERYYDDLAAILRQAVARGDGAEATRALVALGPVLARRAPAHERIARIDEVAALDRDEHTEMGVRLASMRATALREQGRLDDALKTIEAASSHARALGLCGLEASLFDEASACESARGQPERAREEARKAIAVATAAHDRRREARARYRHAIADTDLGDFSSATKQGSRALELYRALGDTLGEALAHVALGACAFEQGHLDVAQRHMNDAEANASRAGERRLEAVAVGYLGGIAHDRGELSLAHDEYLRARAAFEAIAERRLEAIYAGYVGIVTAQRGDLEGGEPAIERARIVLAEIDDARYVAAMDAALVGVRALRGDTSGAAEALARIQASVVGRGSEHLAGVVEVYRGVIEAVSGDLASAERRARAYARAQTEDTRLALPFLHRAIKEQRARASTWVFDARGIAFRAPGADIVRLDTREPLARLVAALVRHRVDRPNTALGRDELVAAAWPGETKLATDSAKNRLKVAVSTLRKAGLEILMTRGSGYLLDPSTPVRVETI
jgi:predicted ATPase